MYRFDFPSIDTCTLAFNGAGIFPSDGAYVNLVTLEVVTPFNFPFNVIGNVDISGILMVEEVNVKGSLSSIQTQVDALINFTGGGVNFRAYSLSSVTINAGNNLDYDNLDYYQQIVMIYRQRSIQA